jgi:hypothetical protein
MRKVTFLAMLSLVFSQSTMGAISQLSDTTRCDSLLSHKFTTNLGKGDPEWNGIRNIRTVLPGILYRSGGNGSYNNLVARPNDGPMTFQGILNLYELGFDKVYYLYANRFTNQYPTEIRQLLNEVGIEYNSIVPVNDSLANVLMRSIYQTIESPEAGPILVHCWNGWHMSGLVSAYALRQFCDFNGEQAWEYWRKNTDGNDKGFSKIKTRIVNFQPDPALRLTKKQQSEYCPCVAEQ